MSSASSISSGGGGGGNVTVDYIKGYVNAANSSTTPLGSGGVFTGAAMDVTDFASINVNVYADVAGASNAVKVEFSADGTNWDHAHSTSYTGGSGRGYIFYSEYKYARVVYTNGATPQAAFRLQTILKPTVVPPSLFTLDSTASGGMFAQLVKANLTAKNPGGNYVSIDCTNGGNLKVSLEEVDAGAVIPLPTGASTEAKQDDLITKLTDVYAFLTTTNLSGGASYTSSIFDIAPEYSQYQTQVLASRDGTLKIYWYSDAGGTDLIRSFTVDYASASGIQVYAGPSLGSYVKFEFTNDIGASQTDFFFSTKFLRRPITGQILDVEGEILKEMTSSLTRSVISGESSAGGGTFVNVKVNPSGTLETNATQSGTWNINNITGTVSLPTGAATETTLSTLNGKIPANLTVTSTRLLVDGSGVTQPVSGTVTSNAQKSATATLSNVAGSASSVVILAANANRLGATIYNDSTAILYLKFGTTASTTSFTVKLNPDDFYELSGPPLYTGILHGIWGSATGAARVTELT